MPSGRPPKKPFKPKNLARVEKLKALSGCKTDLELAEFFGTTQPQVSRWKRVGFDKSIRKIIDFLIDEVDR